MIYRIQRVTGPPLLLNPELCELCGRSRQQCTTWPWRNHHSFAIATHVEGRPLPNNWPTGTFVIDLDSDGRRRLSEEYERQP